MSDQLQLRLFFNDLEGASPVVSGWSETGAKHFTSPPLGSGLNLATSESLIVAAEALDYIDVSVPGDGSNIRGAFLATLKKAETLHAIDFAAPPALQDAFGNLPGTELSPNDTYLYGRVKAGLEAGAIALSPTDAPSVIWQVELDAVPLLAVIKFEILDVDPQRPPEWIVDRVPLGGSAIHFPDLADLAYQAIVHRDEPQPRFQYNGWLQGQQVIPSSMLRVGLNTIVLRLDKKSNALAVRAVELQLKHHWQHLDYKLAPDFMKRSLHFRSAGFTLLEIMLVVMIIAVLAGSAIYFMGGNLGVAQKTVVNTDIKGMKTQLMVYQATNGFTPSTEQGLKALVTKPESSPKPRSWQKLLDKVPLDPYGNEYQYVSPGTHNPDSYDIFSAGKDRIPGTPDDLGNWETQ